MHDDTPNLVPELVEATFDELAEIHNQIVTVRNAVHQMNHHYLAARKHLLALRAATNSVELIEHPDEL